MKSLEADITRHNRTVKEHKDTINQNELQINEKLKKQQDIDERYFNKQNKKSQTTKKTLGEKGNHEKAKQRDIANEETLLASQKQSVVDLQQQIQNQQSKLADVKQQSATNRSELSTIAR